MQSRFRRLRVSTRRAGRDRAATPRGKSPQSVASVPRSILFTSGWHAVLQIVEKIQKKADAAGRTLFVRCFLSHQHGKVLAVRGEIHVHSFLNTGDLPSRPQPWFSWCKCITADG